jgi:hypothetical protein
MESKIQTLPTSKVLGGLLLDEDMDKSEEEVAWEELLSSTETGLDLEQAPSQKVKKTAMKSCKFRVIFCSQI